MAPEVVPSTDDDSSGESTAPTTEVTAIKPKINLTTESDIYAFAMVVIEVIFSFTKRMRLLRGGVRRDVGVRETLSGILGSWKIYPFPQVHVRSAYVCLPYVQIMSGKTPFFHLHKWQISAAVAKGSRPRRTRHASPWINDDLWGLLTECWNQEPELRPDICAVAERLTQM
jgi:hypothetical protein